MANKYSRSSRQKMINLMYLVFIAMLALNVSTEVLDGFDLVEEGLEQTIKSTDSQNRLTINSLEKINDINPQKAGVWFNKANSFIQYSDSIFDYIQNLKVRIVRQADGKNGNLEKIQNKEDLDAASIIMLSKNQEGVKLKLFLDNYRTQSMQLVSNEKKKQLISDRLNTQIPTQGKIDNKTWEQTFFERMPTSAAITLLTKMQSDIRATQGDVLSELLNNITGKDFQVNKVEAEVIPISQFVTEGGFFEGKVVITAVDTTQRPTFDQLSVNDKGDFKIPVGNTIGQKTFSGIAYLMGPDGTVRPYPFQRNYHVVPRMVAIQPELTNVLYRGRDNKLTISVPGMSGDQINTKVSDGAINKVGQFWIVRPGTNNTIDISVYGPNQTLIEKKSFKVRDLPKPAGYINYTDANGVIKRFKGGRISKSAILNADGVRSAIDDGLIDEEFVVTQFTTTFYDAMGNGIREISNGNNFTENQKNQIKQLSRGKTFYITDIKAIVGGKETDVSMLEVRLN